MRSSKVFINLILLGFCRSINYEDQPVENMRRNFTDFLELKPTGSTTEAKGPHRHNHEPVDGRAYGTGQALPQVFTSERLIHEFLVLPCVS